MLRDGHFMASHMQGMGKLTSKFFLMREKHDHEKASGAGYRPLTSFERPRPCSSISTSSPLELSHSSAINNDAAPGWPFKSAISSSAGRTSDAFLVRQIPGFIDRLFARWFSPL